MARVRNVHGIEVDEATKRNLAGIIDHQLNQDVSLPAWADTGRVAEAIGEAHGARMGELMDEAVRDGADRDTIDAILDLEVEQINEVRLWLQLGLGAVSGHCYSCYNVRTNSALDARCSCHA